MTTDPETSLFEKTEKLRRHMMLDKSQMARLLGVSRVTYYSWLNGVEPSANNLKRVRSILRNMLRVMVDHDWPTPEVIVMSPDDRFERLQSHLTDK